GTRVHDGHVGRGRVDHHSVARGGKPLAHQRGVLLGRLAAEGDELDVHGRTLKPSRNVHTRSESPAPVRRRCSRPTSTSARPRANARPVPAANPTSVGAVGPAPNGSCPPRAPTRNGAKPASTSRPADQLTVLNAPAPAPPTCAARPFRRDGRSGWAPSAGRP